jgi:hypothetical protein
MSTVDLAKLGRCDSDDQCPLFQTCIDHGCYSDCAGDDDCHGGRKCYMKTCRVPCTTAESSTCPAGESCSSKDGRAGYCLPRGAPPEAPGTPDPRADDSIESAFTLSANVVTFAPSGADATVTFTNGTSAARAVTVRKVTQTEVKDGAAVVTKVSPLPWLKLGVGDAAPAAVDQVAFTVPADGGVVKLRLAGAKNDRLARWTGELEVSSPGRPSRILTLEFSASPEGQWTGRATYYASFGTRSLDAWMADKGNQVKLNLVGNALVRRWGAFRNGRISWDELRAMLTATNVESWRWASVRARCPSPDAPNPNAACYLYDNAVGISVYSDSVADSPVPAGVTDFPVVLNLRAGASPTSWTGRVVSGEALQYPGEPAVTMTFESDPGVCAGAGCKTALKTFAFDTWAGGRYVTTPDDTECFGSVSFTHVSMPWYVPGFVSGTDADATGRRYRHECRDTTLPYGGAAGKSAFNVSLAGGDPVPDGASRHRHVELVDGVMVDQETMAILFKESFPSFLGASDKAGFTSYGTMLLTRSRAEPRAADYQGVAASDAREPVGLPGPTCSKDLLQKLKPGLTLTPATAPSIAVAMVQGALPAAPTPPINPAVEIVHYLCEATNLFDGGPLDLGMPSSTKVACPAGSAVRYFTLRGTRAAQITVAAMPCQRDASCGALLQTWIDANDADVRLDPLWQCADPSAASCDADRTDLRAGKVFYAAAVPGPTVMPALNAAQITGFRYAENFQSTSGAQVGFAPTVCLDGGSATPFCYDPQAIEELQGRVDCLVDVATRFPTALAANPAAPALVKRALTKVFSYEEEIRPELDRPLIHRGFEELNADLLVMLGDEAFTSALSSRFDLAATNLAGFEGSKLEPGGIDLAGSAGFEMFRLYQAAQLQQLALERFYRLAPRLWSSLKDLPAGQSFVTPASAASYFARLGAASSKKTRVWSQIAKRYKAFNRPDLARLVIQRAYGAAQIEASVLSRMMLGLVDVPSSPHAAQIEAAVSQAQAVSRSALLDMATAYRDISDDVTYIGFPADYVPFPVTNAFDLDVFGKAMTLAQQKVDLAKEKEAIALADSRSFSTAGQTFQSEIASITRDYEAQLADLCGTFAATDPGGATHVYPAIGKYAELSERTKSVGAPCGLVGNGALWTAGQTLLADRAALRALDQQRVNLLAEAADAQERTRRQCARIQDLAAFKLQSADRVLTLDDKINGINNTLRVLDRAQQRVEVLAGLYKCSVGLSTDCPQSAIATSVYIVASSVLTAAMSAAELSLTGLQHEIGVIENATMAREVLQECAAAEIDVQYTVRKLMRDAAQLELEMAKLAVQFRIDAGDIQKKANQADLLQQNMNDSTQLAINVEAARNDPNVRVYRNIAVVEADRTFEEAVAQAYRATRVYEYFTSQSYARRGDLFLVRMVASGDLTLERYLSQLNDAYIRFQEQFGQADTRVVTLSLKDDLLAIPKLGEGGVALTLGQRNDLFHARLAAPTMLDGNGYLTVPFSTTLDRVSPLTSNHKVAYVEAEIIGSDVGDTLGRVYVRQKGTGTIRPLMGEKAYYAFPERTAVVDAFFNGTKFFAPELYQSTRLRDRPFANTAWELVLNQKDEAINKDISLAGLSDIRLYVYYTDFTGQ